MLLIAVNTCRIMLGMHTGGFMDTAAASKQVTFQICIVHMLLQIVPRYANIHTHNPACTFR